MYDNIRQTWFHRILFLIGLIGNKISTDVSTFGENIGHLFFHLTTYKGRVGYIDIDVDEEEADGLIRFRHRNDYGQVVLLEQPFRISNRWLLRNRRCLSGVALFQIRTDANTIHGMDVHSVVLGKYSHNRQEFMPFNLSVLPSDDVIAKRHARMKWVQDTLARLFPARVPANGLSREDIAELIVKKA